MLVPFAAVANLFWISTREFAVMYSPPGAPSADSGLPPATTCVVLLTVSEHDNNRHTTHNDCATEILHLVVW